MFILFLPPLKVPKREVFVAVFFTLRSVSEENKLLFLFLKVHKHTKTWN